mmetsp:Transcript_17522/g.26608  ORF Transcript_17522/g.26608 Transcript_17522/m.26608 type:complete len:588 (+) Transcript_17522:63-1826(+)|eukprot:CAMPEP_0178906266 /NCGR_PEP_ID=MMETSP0786-20121207/6728_1 /TAXON_ID=186022 /ORGANISM="Thalassionema frauenfeldii, Strain CCMP 1798" /LENGTH=587 /DNA_ID=CAMNT_0020577951 /DNA_START=21 /DNA_END=1784 /DNA_ORIENTATION=+
MATSYKSQQPPPVVTAGNMDEDYDYAASISPKERAFKEYQKAALPPPPPPPPPQHLPSSENGPDQDPTGEDALLDLAQLEELHQEAEKMKALGNKHMAAQEYTRAYNAYSAALQLSPVGPSSHVFLSNRAAALLSLKRYSAAATDARRAVALAPTFGKAHARLGQSLYFLKDYEGAVAAYEEAVHFEPDNEVTKTYLQKARNKLSRQLGRNKDESSIADTTFANSIATDPHAKAAVVTQGFRGSAKQIIRAVAHSQEPPIEEGNQDDPDFDEALRIQQRANRFLSSKNYKPAIEEYSAALFLVPDDPVLSPELHLGRAHALNGSRRHESARNDSLLAVKLRPSPEGYSTLAKSCFYLKDYEGALEAFDQCIELLPNGEALSTFDQAYYDKAETAIEEGQDVDDGKSVSTSRSLRSIKSVVPKLPPPRFVPREEAMAKVPNIPPPPKHWPQQSPRTPSALKIGPERNVVFLSDSLGVKLNRGPDGIVRVLSVIPNTPGSPIIRNGNLEVGDVIREAAGVDVRRPITNVMWGDTVALVKMAPRPITLVVAKEISEIPISVIEEREKVLSNTRRLRPSESNNREEKQKEI